MSDNIGSVRTITRREINRKPSLLSRVAPGESVLIEDRRGGMVLTRPITNRLSAEEIAREIAAVASGCPKVDVDAILLNDE